MLRHILSEVKEALICLRAGRVTLKYPFEPAPAPPDYRGKPVLDMEKCTGCGACANACSSRLIAITEEETHRLIDYQLERCIHCGRCEEVCPDDAVKLSPEFELATASKDDLHIRARFLLQRCEGCGEVVGTKRQVTKLLEQIPEKIEGLDAEAMSWLTLCTSCRRKKFQAEGLSREIKA